MKFLIVCFLGFLAISNLPSIQADETGVDYDLDNLYDEDSYAAEPSVGELDSENFCDTLVEVATQAGLDTLLLAATEAGLVETLLEFEGTVFAPTEEAFADALKTLNLTAAELLANTDVVTDVLLLHAVPEVVFSTDLEDGATVPTLSGAELEVSITDEGVFIISPSGVKAAVVLPDVATCNSIVHVIDQVLLP